MNATMNDEQGILLVEDNDDDADLAMLAFNRTKLPVPLTRVSNGVEALDYIFARGEYAGRSIERLPLLVLLDLNLPKLNGFEVLKLVREDARTQCVPIVVLTSSNEERDRLEAYLLCANSYVLKPVNYDQFLTTAQQLGSYWIGLNQPAPYGKSLSR
jgi:two-component system, response regulator